jgi:hypothetical protein
LGLLAREHGNAAASQIGRQLRQPVIVILGEPVYDRHVLAFEVSGVFEALT